MAKVILLLLITVITATCYGQWHRLNERTEGFRLLYGGEGLPTLTANTNTVWAGYYPAIGTGSDTINPPTRVHMFLKKPQYKVRQTGTITQLGMYVVTASAVDTLIVELWRPDNSLTSMSILTRQAVSDNLKPQLVNGANLVTTSLNAQEGDIIAIYYAGTINAIQFTDGVAADSVKTFTARQTSTSLNISSGTAYAHRYGVRVYMQAPVVVLIGNSIIDGAGNVLPNWISGASHLQYQTLNRQNQIGYLLCANNYTYQNMGVSSQGVVSGIQPRFESDVTALRSRLNVVEGGTNDIASNNYSVAVSNAIKKMIDSSVANNQITYVIGIPPRNGFTNNRQRTADSTNSIVSAYCLTKANTYFIDTRTAMGIPSDSGSGGWWCNTAYFASDYLHPSFNGNAKIAGLIFSHHKTQYTVNDTNRMHITGTVLTDTATPELTNMQITANAFCGLGVDSVQFQYRINGGAVNTAKMNYASSTYLTNGFNDTTNIDTTGVNTITYRYYAYGYANGGTEWATINITDRIYEPEYLALYNRYGTKPPSYIMGTENRLIKNLKSYTHSSGSGTLWSKMDVFYVLAVPNEANSLLNWVVDSNNCSNVSSYPFTANTGYEGSGSAGYLNTNFIPSTDATNYTLNSGSLGVYILEDVAENKTDMGASTAFLQTRLGANNFTYLVNGGSNVANSDSRGLFIASRLTGASLFSFRNNDSLNSSTTAASSLPNAAISIGAYGSGFNSSKQIAFAFMGAGFSKLDCQRISISVNAYMTEKGINKY